MMQPSCAINGAVVKPPMARQSSYHLLVATNYRKTLAQNVRDLMAQSPDLGSHAKLAKKCKIGSRTIGRLLIADEASPTLDTIVAVAEAFHVAPEMLLNPNFDAAQRRIEPPPSDSAIQLARKISQMPKEIFDALAADTVSNSKVEAAGFAAQPKYSVHENALTYEPRPRTHTKKTRA